MYSYAYYELGDHHDAEDATERTFLRALAALPRFREQARPADGPRGLHVPRLAVPDRAQRRGQRAPVPPAPPGLVARRGLGADRRRTPRHRGRRRPATRPPALRAVPALPDDRRRAVVLRFVDEMSTAGDRRRPRPLGGRRARADPPGAAAALPRPGPGPKATGTPAGRPPALSHLRPLVRATPRRPGDRPRGTSTRSSGPRTAGPPTAPADADLDPRSATPPPSCARRWCASTPRSGSRSAWPPASPTSRASAGAAGPPWAARIVPIPDRRRRRRPAAMLGTPWPPSPRPDRRLAVPPRRVAPAAVRVRGRGRRHHVGRHLDRRRRVRRLACVPPGPVRPQAAPGRAPPRSDRRAAGRRGRIPPDARQVAVLPAAPGDLPGEALDALPVVRGAAVQQAAREDAPGLPQLRPPLPPVGVGAARPPARRGDLRGARRRAVLGGSARLRGPEDVPGPGRRRPAGDRAARRRALGASAGSRASGSRSS